MSALKSYGDFTKAPSPADIPHHDTLHKTAKAYLRLLEMRAEENRGDTKMLDTKAAELLGISRQQIHNIKKKLIEKNFISTLSKRFRTNKGVATAQVFRCWRVVYKFRFHIRTKSLWRTDIRGKFKNGEIARGVGREWLISRESTSSDQFGRVYTFTPKWQELWDFAECGMWDLGTDGQRYVLEDYRENWLPEGVKKLGYPSYFKAKQILKLTDEDLELYYADDGMGGPEWGSR